METPPPPPPPRAEKTAITKEIHNEAGHHNCKIRYVVALVGQTFKLIFSVSAFCQSYHHNLYIHSCQIGVRIFSPLKMVIFSDCFEFLSDQVIVCIHMFSVVFIFHLEN